MKFIINSNANALLALTHAEGSTKINSIAYVIFSDESLKLLNNLT